MKHLLHLAIGLPGLILVLDPHPPITRGMMITAAGCMSRERPAVARTSFPALEAVDLVRMA